MASSLTHAHSFLHAHACLDLNNDYVACCLCTLKPASWHMHFSQFLMCLHLIPFRGACSY